MIKEHQIRNISENNLLNNELIDVIKNVRLLNDIQSDINSIVLDQDEKIDDINLNLENTEQNLEISLDNLEKASNLKSKMKPLLIGTTIGIFVSLPVSIPIYFTVSTSSSLIGYSMIGGGFLGGLTGYNFA